MYKMLVVVFFEMLALLDFPHVLIIVIFRNAGSYNFRKSANYNVRDAEMLAFMIILNDGNYNVSKYWQL